MISTIQGPTILSAPEQHIMINASTTHTSATSSASEQLANTMASTPEFMSSTAPEHKIKSFPFLDLAPELRNIIYEMALLSPDPVIIYPHRNFNHTGPLSVRCRPAGTSLEYFKPIVNLLRTCKFIHCEAMPILYSNKFQPAHGTACETFLLNIGTSIQHIRNLRIANCWLRNDQARLFRTLIAASSLQTLTLDHSFRRMFIVSKDIVRELLPLLMGMKEKRKDGEGTKAIVDIVQFLPLGITKNAERQAMELRSLETYRAEVKRLLQKSFK